MLAVAPKNDAWKKNVRLSRADFDEICNELRPYVSSNILLPNHRKEGCRKVEKKEKRRLLLYCIFLKIQRQ